MKNVLITGACGYIGENLNNYLLFNGYKTNIYCDKKLGMKAEDIKYFDGFDCIVHLAAISGIQNCEDNFEEAIKSNLISTHRIFKEAMKQGIKVIFTSSQASKNPISSFYAMCKKAGEDFAIKFNKMGGNNIVLRLTNVYGGIGYMEKKNTVVKKFIQAYKNCDCITIHGDGKQTRDFLHVKDVCRAIRLAIETDKKIEEPIDIGTGVETSIIDLSKMLGCMFTFDKKSDRIGVNSGTANIEEAKKVLGFEYKEKIEDYIKSMKG